MRNAAAHHTGIRLYGNYLRQAGTCKNAVICFVDLSVVLLKILLRSMEGICVLHGKFTNADKPCARSCLVAELRLNLIYHKRVFGI